MMLGNTANYLSETGHQLIFCSCFIKKNIP